MSAAFALDAADGVIDGSYFGRGIVSGPGGFSATTMPTTYGSTFGGYSSFPTTTAGGYTAGVSSFSTAYPTTSFPTSYPTTSYPTTSYSNTSYPPMFGATTTLGNSSALALDAADGVIDGKYFGSGIVSGSTAYGTSSLALGAPATYLSGGFGASTVTGYGYGQNIVTDDVVVGEEVINVPVRVPIRVRREIQHVHLPPLPSVPQIQYVDKVVAAPAQIKEVEKVTRVWACNGCGKDIEGEHLEMANGRFHRECYIDCAGCGRWIQFDAYEGLGQMWHREHFLCVMCGASCADGWVHHNGRAAHSACVPKKVSQTNPGMAAKREIKAKTFEEAVRYDEMGGGAPDGKYNGITIVCDDPRWQERCRARGYETAATWECSDATVAQRYKTGSGKTVVSTDGQVDGNV
eukprot:NODE_2407_length_1427_cov_323.275307_g2289_i0.p1 GENE.NODE_2407_length_1427_cov_323.275307_g2289_i0~~NODE_2407_length_1427_cov_323.275307_g2289_i0.p1  ORF type:complete len:424 (+),score=117.18 NODE_2407_length_1427_cov_323.275307_g2289_i0:58-1272(+)